MTTAANISNSINADNRRLSARQFIYCWTQAGKTTTVWEVSENAPLAERKKGFVNVMRMYLGKLNQKWGTLTAEEIERRIEDYTRQIKQARANKQTDKVVPKYPKRRQFSSVAALENSAEDLDEVFSNFNIDDAFKEADEKKEEGNKQVDVEQAFKDLMES